MAKGAYIGVSGKARKIKKMYIGVGGEPRALPAGYTQVQYLESTGTQYIDTEFAPTAEDMRVVCDVAYTKTPSGTCLYGAQTTSTTFPITLGADGDKPTFFVGSSLRLLTQTMSVNTRYVLSAHAKNGTLTAGVNGATSTASYSGSLAKTLSLSLWGNNNNGKVESCASAKVYSCQIYGNGTLVRDFVPCTNASGTAGMYDMVNSKFYTNAGTGTFTAGSTNLSVARRIKKAYIGDATGVARLFLTQGEVTRKSAKTLSAGREMLAAATVGNYALFAGGFKSPSASDVVDAFDRSLTRTAATKLASGRYRPTGASVGSYALFCGGIATASMTEHTFSSSVDAYNESLTWSKPSSVIQAASMTASASVGDYAIIAGGQNSTKTLNTVYAYNSSLTRKSVTALTDAVCGLAATRVGGYAVFAGGYYEPGTGGYRYSAYGDAYNASLTKTKLTDLSIGRPYLAATTVGRYAIFGGGTTESNTRDSTVDAFDESLVRTTPTSLRVGRRYLCAETLGDFAIFGGGEGSGKTVDLYDTSLTRTSGTSFVSEKTKEHASTVIGDYALFGGGDSVDGTKVEVYTLE